MNMSAATRGSCRLRAPGQCPGYRRGCRFLRALERVSRAFVAVVSGVAWSSSASVGALKDGASDDG